MPVPAQAGRLPSGNAVAAVMDIAFFRKSRRSICLLLFLKVDPCLHEELSLLSPSSDRDRFYIETYPLQKLPGSHPQYALIVR